MNIFIEKNATLPLGLCLSGFARWHYGGISGIFRRFLVEKHAETWFFTVFFELINEKVQNFGTSSANRLHF